MNTHADKTQEDKRQSASVSDSKIEGDSKSTFQLVDNRRDAITQRKQQAIANNHATAQLQSVPILQRQYYDATANSITERPEETKAIGDAKKKEKEDALLKGYPIDKFTAHHKYPWNKIKDDIENAFVAPKTDASDAALDNLEKFSKLSFPVTRNMFLKEGHRISTYGNREGKIDSWIKEVCWVPGNIFIGPLSDKRIDDPSKREGENDFDGHYTRPRRMSIRSEGLSEVYKAGGLKSKSISIGDNSVGGYDQNEWQGHDREEGKLADSKLYSQKNDPYFEENIFPFSLPAAPIKIEDHKADDYSFEITLPENIKIPKVGYTRVNLGPAKDATQMVAPVLTKTENGVNFYTVTVLTASKYLLNNFKAGLVKDTGEKKAVDLVGVSIKRV